MITIFVGAPGSGKSSALVKRLLERAVAGRDLAANYELNEPNFYAELRRRGVSKPDAMRCLRRFVTIRTYEQLRSLKNRHFSFDEAHMWYNSRMWERITMDDVQSWSQIRKSGVDVDMATQRLVSIDGTVRELAIDIWQVRPLVNHETAQMPFVLAYKIQRKMKENRSQWVGMFLYTQVQDAMGNTREARKGLTGALSKKSLMVLSKGEAGCYDTGKWFASPLVEEAQRQQRRKILAAIYLGHTLPLETCPVCNGLGRCTFEFRDSDVHDGVWRPSAEARSYDFENDLVSQSACPICDGSGYYQNPASRDIEAAREAAFSGFLGPELKAHEEKRRSAPSGLVLPPPSLRRGGGGRYARRG